jgi:ribosomal protein S8
MGAGVRAQDQNSSREHYSFLAVGIKNCIEVNNFYKVCERIRKFEGLITDFDTFEEKTRIFETNSEIAKNKTRIISEIVSISITSIKNYN